VSVELFEAIEAGDDQRVRALVAADPKLASARNDDGLSAVLFAKYRGQTEIARALVAVGAELDVFDAAATGQIEVLNALRAADASLAGARSPDGFTALHYAAFFADGPTVEALLEAGADPSAVAGNPMRVQPLHSAAAARNVEGARLLLAAGADPNAEQQDGYLPLDAAVQNGDDAMQEVLRDHGARTSR
jgi:ankyrin repeat protein